MPTDLALESHAPYVAVIALAVILGLVMTIAAIHDHVARRRERRAWADRAAAELDVRTSGRTEGFRRGWHG